MPFSAVRGLFAAVLLIMCSLVLFHGLNTKIQGNNDYPSPRSSYINRPEVERSKPVLVETTPCSSNFSCLPNDLKGTQQDDPRLIEYIQTKMMKPPSTQPYNLAQPNRIHYSQIGQSKFANSKFLRGMKSGFFVEAGAVDGEYLSNTLFFEKELGWRGLLIEPYPKTYEKLLTKHRNAYSINVALSVSPEATEVNFKSSPGLGTLGHLSSEGIKIPAIPLFSLLKALNVTVVDFLSLDIEAYEVKILKTIPWDEVKFRLMCIEVNHIPEGSEYLTNYLTEKGYVALGIKGYDAWYGWPELLNSTRKT